MLEIRKTEVGFFFISLKHNGLCGRLADSNYFYTEESMPCTNFRVCVIPLVCIFCAWSKPCKQFVKTCNNLILPCSLSLISNP